MEIKLIATDLDGTLMSPDHMTITERTVTALKKANDAGIKTAVATGRPLGLLGQVINRIPFIDYLICSNGAAIYTNSLKKEQIYLNAIPSQTAESVFNILIKTPYFIEYYIDGKSHYQNGHGNAFVNVLPPEFINEVAKTMTGHDDLGKFIKGKDIEKITLYNVDDANYQNIKTQLAKFGFSISSSLPGNLECTVGTADKGFALKALCDFLSISENNVMAFGDENNDIAMMEFAGYSFAMGNGSDGCKKAAKFVTLSNAFDGLAVAVEKYVLNA